MEIEVGVRMGRTFLVVVGYGGFFPSVSNWFS